MRSLTLKWLLTLLLTSLVGVFLVGLFAYQATVNEYDRFRIEQAQEDFWATLSNFYEEHQSWDGLTDWLMQSFPLNRDFRIFPPQTFVIVDNAGKVLVASHDFQVNQQLDEALLKNALPILVDNVQVGRAILSPPNPQLDPREQAYVDGINRALLLGILGGSLVALVIGWVLSRQFLFPLAELRKAIVAMREGNLEQQVAVQSKDELGQLAETFNAMSAEIHRANQLRKQMTADIAHDLRTPLNVIMGYIEAMRDGVLPATRERFDTMNHEASLLKRLIEDLRTLSLVDAKELKLIYQTISPRELLEQVQQSFEPLAQQKLVTLLVNCEATLPELKIDRERMLQVLANLLSNALRYTPQGGTIRLSAIEIQRDIQLVVEDTGAGIPKDQLLNIFERFYRIDESRQEIEGESGLGLAIAKSLVEAHDGKIRAESQLGQGTRMIICLPK